VPLRRPVGRAVRRACGSLAVLWRPGRRPCNASSRASPCRPRSFCGRSVPAHELASDGRSVRPPLSTRPSRTRSRRAADRPRSIRHG
jgi:hypothetical protein